MRNLHDIKSQILDAIAPANWRELAIKGATLQLVPNKIPTLTLVCEFLPEPGGPLESLAKVFELWPVPAAAAPAFDLDAAFRQAKAEVARCIEASAKWHGYVLQTKFGVARKGLARAPGRPTPAMGHLRIEGLL